VIDAALIVWFILTGVSVAYVAWDTFTRNPNLTVMKYGWGSGHALCRTRCRRSLCALLPGAGTIPT